MSSNTDFRKAITDPTPLYFAAGVIEKVRVEAPERIAKVRSTDPKLVQERVQGVLATLDSDIKKLREQAQHLALQGVGYAAEYAVKAKEGYDSLALQGKSAVENWRGQDDSATSVSDVTYETTIEREPVTVTEDKAEEKAANKAESKPEEKATAGKAESKSEVETESTTRYTTESDPTSVSSPKGGKSTPKAADQPAADKKAKANTAKKTPKSGS